MGKMKVNLIPKDYWPSCSHSPKTLSFRRPSDSTTTVFKTLNSVYFNPDSDSDSSNSDENDEDKDIESIVRGAHSDTTRLFFQPSTGKAISLPVEEPEEEKDKVGPEPFKESVVMALESEDPYIDFKRSMQEMMEAQALLKDWGSLEELLAWYLRVNSKNNHAYIVAAFVDLLVKFSSSSNSSGSSTSDGASSSLNINISSRSTSRSSSSCACDHCHRRRHREMVVAGKAKSTTSFSSAASSFSSSDEAGEQR